MILGGVDGGGGMNRGPALDGVVCVQALWPGKRYFWPAPAPAATPGRKFESGPVHLHLPWDLVRNVTYPPLPQWGRGWTVR